MSIFSFAESFSDTRNNPYDISRYIDRVGLICATWGPLSDIRAGTDHGADPLAARIGPATVRQARRSADSRDRRARSVQRSRHEEGLAQFPDGARRGEALKWHDPICISTTGPPIKTDFDDTLSRAIGCMSRLYSFRQGKEFSGLADDTDWVHLGDDRLIGWIAEHEIPHDEQSVFPQICSSP